MCLLQNIASFVNATAYCSLNAILAKLNKVPLGVYTMIELKNILTTVMRRITTGIRSEKCVVRRFRRFANVIECIFTNLDSIA